MTSPHNYPVNGFASAVTSPLTRSGFFVQFLNVFSELQGKNLYLAGESYAGFYVPCV